MGAERARADRELSPQRASVDEDDDGALPVAPWVPPQLPFFLFALTVRLALAGAPHSGMATPPRFGDYEAQRHWMEVTNALPSGEWYRDSLPVNDLDYWGLDYPPLSAYLAWFAGKVAGAIGLARLVEPLTSHGIEDAGSKAFMRLSVVLLDCALLFPVIRVLVRLLWRRHAVVDRKSPAWPRLRRWAAFRIQTGWLIGALLPLAVLVDHGHFQYNGVALALALGVVAACGQGKHWPAAVLGVACVNFKQIGLYYVPAWGVFYLARLVLERRLRLFLLLVSAALTAQVLILAPLVYGAHAGGVPPDAVLLDLVHRMFPWNRGLFEDKVANFWCATHPVARWKDRFERPQLRNMCLLATAVVLVPLVVRLVVLALRRCARGPVGSAAARFSSRVNDMTVLLYAMTVSALAFFLFAYQVHEKSILFALVPLTMLYHHMPVIVAHANVVAVFSCLPLLVRDGLLVHSLALVLLFLLVHHAVAGHEAVPKDARARAGLALSFAGMGVLTLLLAYYPAGTALPIVGTRFPDLVSVAVASFSFLHIGALLVYLLATGPEPLLAASKAKAD